MRMNEISCVLVMLVGRKHSVLAVSCYKVETGSDGVLSYGCFSRHPCWTPRAVPAFPPTEGSS